MLDPTTGQTKPGQGIGRHRPWESKSTDTLEPADIVDGKPEAFDAEGRKVVFCVREEPVRAFGITVWRRRKVAVADVEAEPSHATALQSALITALGPSSESASESLEELVRAATQKFGVR